jgi:hypothetical protein
MGAQEVRRLIWPAQWRCQGEQQPAEHQGQRCKNDSRMDEKVPNQHAPARSCGIGLRTRNGEIGHGDIG